MIKTFRGLLADGEEEKIRLSTKQGLIGYKIKKFQVINSNPGGVDYSAVAKVNKTSRAVVSTVDFTDPNLLAVNYFSGDLSSTQFPEDTILIFDEMKFNQDIFITVKQTASSDNDSLNYYLELEQVALTENEATVATLKDMRGRE